MNVGNCFRAAGDRHRVKRSTLNRVTLATASTVALALLGVSCGSDATDTVPSASESDVDLSAAAERGRELASSKGCSGCHGSDFSGSTGPTWIGLAGSEVELNDGSFVLADDLYLARAIGDPSAERRADYSLQMPKNNLSDSEVADVVEYIKSLGLTSDGDTQQLQEVPADRVLAGIVREPAPQVDQTAIPSLSVEGETVEFRASADGLQVVYFGYTNCPDVCPTTMFDLTVALRLLPDEMDDRVDTVMVTIDPDRDLDLLAEYVTSFVPDAVAAGTLDPTLLEEAAEPFGVSYGVTVLEDGEIEVVHSGFLYVVNDKGELLLAWPFGTTSEEMAADMFQLLEREAQ